MAPRNCIWGRHVGLYTHACSLRTNCSTTARAQPVFKARVFWKHASRYRVKVGVRPACRVQIASATRTRRLSMCHPVFFLKWGPTGRKFKFSFVVHRAEHQPQSDRDCYVRVSDSQYSARIKHKVLGDGFNRYQGPTAASDGCQTTPAKFCGPNFTFNQGGKWALQGRSAERLWAQRLLNTRPDGGRRTHQKFSVCCGVGSVLGVAAQFCYPPGAKRPQAPVRLSSEDC